ncbi:hypothetical protein [Desulfocastanea catecholica]
MAIWIPEPLYRILPLLCLAAGFVFTFTISGPVSLTLNVLLVGYGVSVMAMRAGYRTHA